MVRSVTRQTGQLDVTDFGAEGDGVTDDTAACQAAVDAAVASGYMHVVWPPGVYAITSIDIEAGLTLSGYGATLLRPPTQPNGTRTFTNQNRVWSGTEDSPMIVIEGFTIDGNRANQGPYDTFQLEQSMLIFIQGDRTQPGRTRTTIKDVVCKESVSDGVHVWYNTDTKITDSYFWDCFRGGFVQTGGHSRLSVENVTTGGNVHESGFDIEVDALGFNGSEASEFHGNNMHVQGDWDIGVKAGSHVTVSNSTMDSGQWSLTAPEANVLMTNCFFKVGEAQANRNRIFEPGETTFNNCKFTLLNDSGSTATNWYAMHVYWFLAAAPRTDQILTFSDCTFDYEAPLDPATSTLVGIYSESDDVANNNLMVVDNCHFAPGFEHSIRMNLGGTLHVQGTTLRGDRAIYLGTTTGFVYHAILDNVRFDDIGTNCMHAVAGIAGPIIDHRNVYIDAADNEISAAGGGLSMLTHKGYRIIRGSAPPTGATDGLLGDHYIIEPPVSGSPYEWVCTSQSFGGGAVWRELSTVA